MKIQKIKIKRFRSILDISIELDSINEIVTICGPNNSGKTNILRAINTFFNPEIYIAERDSPNHKYHGSRGGAVYPEITLEFVDKNIVYEITRVFNLKGYQLVKGKKREGEENKKIKLSEQEIENVLKKVSFFYIPSINISTPDLINSLIEDIYDLEYEKSRFRGLKQDLKDSFENYINGIVEILNSLAEEINPLFEQFNENWQVGFEFISDVKKFRDLISSDIDFFFNDKSNRYIEGKGSGLQRLGFILLHSRIIKKIGKRNPILLIDEPDVYLHQGLQKSLYNHLCELCAKSQVIITTHSPVFINSYKLVNTFLLDLEVGEKQLFKRTDREFHPLKTVLVNLEEETGFKKIRDYLGIELDDFEILDHYNVLVEGDSDKKYITEISKYFNLKIPNIIPAHGVTNFEKHLEFYNSFYKGKENSPKILLIFDNDTSGRNEYKKIYKKNGRGHYKNLKIKCEFISTYEGSVPDHTLIIEDLATIHFSQ